MSIRAARIWVVPIAACAVLVIGTFLVVRAIAESGRDDLRFSVSHGQERASFDGGPGDRTHAVARAQVYYHRPGAWQEMPNFFNPFWRAKLAPVDEGLSRVPFAGQLLSAVPEALRSAVLTH